ncbi:hypothetical protein CT19425_U350072 [Cupriavidus taiwanensis]|uniref:Uncharacterized protein n=1 Tax=Cupriavidus taiwanensis TaxID=164546 RepID=A0A375I9T0_9BURK|nr:hypothetical protein CT19425_U350072 [Cupriavidus taiwanensis]
MATATLASDKVRALEYLRREILCTRRNVGNAKIRSLKASRHLVRRSPIPSPQASSRWPRRSFSDQVPSLDSFRQPIEAIRGDNEEIPVSHSFSLN